MVMAHPYTVDTGQVVCNDVFIGCSISINDEVAERIGNLLIYKLHGFDSSLV